MRPKRAINVVTTAGSIAWLALAAVVYRLNNGGETALCLIGFALGQFAAFQYLVYCNNTCPPVGEEGHSICVSRCILTFIIIQDALIIGFVVCTFTFGFSF